MSKPRLYSTIPNARFRQAKSELTTQQLRFWLWLEFKAGSDQDAIQPDYDLTLAPCRYVRVSYATITKTLGYSQNQTTRRMLERLKKLGYVLNYCDDLILLPQQGKTDQYFQNYESALFTDYWQPLAVLLASKVQRGGSFQVKAGKRFLRSAGFGKGQGMKDKDAWISQVLAALQRYGVLKLFKAGPPQVFEINMAAIAKLPKAGDSVCSTAERKQKQTQRLNTHLTRRSSAVEHTLGSAVEHTKENALTENASPRKPSPQEQPGGEQDEERAGERQIQHLEKLLATIRNKGADTTERLTAALSFQTVTEQLLHLNPPKIRRNADVMEALAALEQEITAADLLASLRIMQLREKVWTVLIEETNWERVVFSAANTAGCRLLDQHKIYNYYQPPGWSALQSFHEKMKEGVNVRACSNS